MFSASWCGPCQRTKPAFLDFKEQSKDNFQCEIIDVDESEILAHQYGIRSVPTFVLIKEGKEVARTSGGMTADKIKEFANQ
jgi:thioredoxin 2